MKLYSCKFGSKSAKALAEALGCLRIKHKGSRYYPKAGHTIINWGASQLPARLLVANILNKPEAVANVSNKLTFAKLTGHIEYVTNRGAVTPAWFETGGVVCRTILTGHSGAGIVISEGRGELVDAPLYTRYYKKKEEFRVHIFQGRVIHIQRKARSKAVPDDQVNWKVRNHGNGFIFQINFDRGNYDVAGMEAEALRIFNMTGLDFGAVDIMLTVNDGWKVLEINTACGLEAGGTTLDRYKEAFSNLEA